VLILLSGTAELRRDGRALILSEGMTARVHRGEHVSLANLGPVPASLMVIDSPPGFAGQLAAWPAA
jgi:mannose-6-phosphate isomerase-like protein (cupin superfamily)